MGNKLQKVSNLTNILYLGIVIVNTISFSLSNGMLLKFLSRFSLELQYIEIDDSLPALDNRQTFGNQELSAYPPSYDSQFLTKLTADQSKE